MTAARTVEVHGYGAYARGCRCSQCRAAKAEYMCSHRAELARTPAPTQVHGTRNGYDNWRCRCTPCVEAKRAASRDYDQRRPRLRRAS